MAYEALQKCIPPPFTIPSGSSNPINLDSLMRARATCRRNQRIWEFVTEKPSKAFNVTSIGKASYCFMRRDATPFNNSRCE